MQAMGHMMAEVDACQRTLGKVLCIHDLHSYSNTQARGRLSGLPRNGLRNDIQSLP